MNDLVNMAVNLKVPTTKGSNSSKETFKNVKGSIDISNKTNTHNNFKNLLHNASEKANVKNNEVSKDEQIQDVKSQSDEIQDDLKNNSSKPAKNKKNVLDLLLILLLQHLGDEKVDIKKIMEELNKDDSSNEDVTTEIMNLVGNVNISEVDIEGLKASNNLQKSVDDIINALLKESKGSNNENSKLNELLSKMKSINDEDANNLNMNETIKDLQSIFMEASKELKQDSFIKEHILSVIKDKLNQSNLVNNDLQVMDSIHSSDSIKLLTQMENTNSDSSAGYNKDGKEEEFLKGLTSNKSKLESKVDRVTNFMNDFTKVNNEVSTNNVEAPITINKNSLVNDFIKSIKYMEQNNVKEMTVKVKPQELGEVVIRLTVENGLMKANITANNKEAYNLLNSKLQDLNNSLGNGEIKIQNFTIDIYNGDTTFFSRENSKEQRNNPNGNNREKNNGISSLEDNINSNEQVKSDLEDSNVNAFV